MSNPPIPDDPGGLDLLPVVYDELRDLAASYLRRERVEHTLQPTALVNEAYVRLAGRSAIHVADREQFLAVAAQAMRRVLVDHARSRARAKRGGDVWSRITLDEGVTPAGGRDVDLLELDDLLDKLAARDERAARIVELRFFGGLSVEQTARLLDISVRTAENDWFVARGWLAKQLGPGGHGSAGTGP